MPPGPAVASRDHAALSLAERFLATRALTLDLVAPLTAEDFAVQSMPDASPAKWHLAHTSWFFEQFVLTPRSAGYRAFDERFGYLFNSYYESVGPRHRRPERGLLTRPTIDEVRAYRAHVDDAVQRWFATRRHDADELIELGIQHEQQHQELILTDLKHLFFCNPLLPAYVDLPRASAGHTRTLAFHRFTGGIYEIGHEGPGFAFDNETPRHRVFVDAFELAERLVTNGEFREFVRDRGYERAELWLSDGWALLNANDWTRPLYWSESLQSEFTLGGERELAADAPVCHVSYYEADAFARWARARLPTEAEWEVAAQRELVKGNLLRDSVAESALHPLAPRASRGEKIRQLFGDVWEWTSSAYCAYPGFVPLAGELGEYNAKFMANQYVLRGGSCATPASHIRASYRNFFYPQARWQFSGIRLAKGAAA